MQKVVFETRPTDPFAEEVRSRVATYFEERGISQHANVAMMLKSVIILAFTITMYCLVVFSHFPPLVLLGLAILMGVGVAGIGFCVAHDALHGAYSSKAWVNRTLGATFDILGANGYMWNITHNVIHHTYTNLQGIDEDLDVSPLVRLSPRADWKPFHRFQQFYFPLLYSLSLVFWVFGKDFKHFLQRDIGPYKGVRHPARAIVSLAAGKLVYVAYMIVIPLLVMRIAWWQYLVGYLAMNLTAGIILGVVFQLAHVVEQTEHPVCPPDGHVGEYWMRHEMATTANFANGNPVLSWCLGGLNFQIEHHLFSKVCSVHYPAISPIVRDVAHKYGVPYNSHPTMRGAVRSHLKMLQLYGLRPEATPAAIPG